MVTVGDAYDNALCESFFATLERELLARRRLNRPLKRGNSSRCQDANGEAALLVGGIGSFAGPTAGRTGCGNPSSGTQRRNSVTLG
jgi:hypothetical protein